MVPNVNCQIIIIQDSTGKKYGYVTTYNQRWWHYERHSYLLTNSGWSFENFPNAISESFVFLVIESFYSFKLPLWYFSWFSDQFLFGMVSKLPKILDLAPKLVWETIFLSLEYFKLLNKFHMILRVVLLSKHYSLITCFYDFITNSVTTYVYFPRN